METQFFRQISEGLDSRRQCRVAIPFAQDEACAYAVCQAVTLGFAGARLIGDPGKIRSLYGQTASHPKVEIIAEGDAAKACRMAVLDVREGRADIMMKGLVPTSTLLKSVLNSQEGLKRNPLLSHLLFFEERNRPGLRILTDVAISIAPDAETLAKEIDNAVEAFALFSSHVPRVALLSANEKVSEKVPSTVLAQKVAEGFANRTDVVVEGPISLDLAISPESAQVKKYGGRIQGNADILVVPRIEVGNVLYKSLHYFADAHMGGVVYGARCPVVLTSRADTNETKFNSLLLAMVLWQREAKR